MPTGHKLSLERWGSKNSSGRHFDLLDGIRGSAILMVVAFHAFYFNPQSGSALILLDGLLGGGWMGVPVFFVLSGFLISEPFFRQRKKNEDSWHVSGYALRRMGKIMPPFYLSVVVLTIFYSIHFSNLAYLKSGFLSAIGLLDLIPSGLRLNGSYWSLVVETQFYVILPLLFLLTKGFKINKTTGLLFFLLLLIPFIARQLSWPVGSPTLPEATAFSLVARFPCQLDYFAFGVLFSGLFTSLEPVRDKVGSLGSLGYAGVALFGLTLWLWMSWSRQFNLHSSPSCWSTEIFHFLPATSAFFLLFFVFDPASFGNRFLSCSPLRFIGIISYEWFLLHQPVIFFFKELLPKSNGNLIIYSLRTFMPLALSFGLSVLIYHFFSLPLLNWFRKKAHQRSVVENNENEAAKC
ncbi:MAG: putative acyltransferase [Pedosphaera sp.]|nr:putative acyltransferase [Pedosphaera sp.]